MALGGAIKLTGESEYRKALNKITANLKEVTSEMKMVTNSYDKNDKSVTALTAKQEVLNKRLKEQQDKVNTISQQYKKYEEAVAQSAKEHEELGRSLQNEKAKLNLIKAQLGENNFQYQAQKVIVDQLEKEYNDSTKAQDANAESLRKLRTDMNNAQADVNKTAREVDNLEEELKEAKDPVKQLGDAFKKAGDDAKDSSDGYSVVKNVLSNLATKVIIGAINGLKKLGSAFANVGKQAIESFSDYEQLSGGAQKIFNEMDYNKIAKDAQNAYKNMGISANQYLQIMTSVGANFASTLGDEKGYEVAKKGMQAITDFATGTGKSIDELSQKYQLITKSAGSYQSIADQFAGILPATSASFLEQAQAAGLLSDKYKKLTEVPIEEYQNAVTEMLIKGVDAIGLTGNTLSEAETTISGSLEMLKASWQNLVTGLADSNQDMGPLVDNFVDALITAGKNLAPRIKDVISGIQELISQIWTDVLPELGKEVPELGKFVDALMWVKDNGATIVSVLSGIVAGLVAFKVAGQITSLITGFTTFFGVVSSGEGIMAGLNAVMSANPFGLIAMAVAGLVTAFITLWNTSEGFRNFWIGMWENIKTAFTKAWEAISEGLNNAWNNIVEIFTTAKDSVVQAWQDVSAWFIEQWDKIKTGFSNVGTWFSEKFTEAKDGVINAFKSIPEWFRTTFTKAWENVKAVFSTGGKIFTGIKEGIEQTFKTIVNGIIKGINKIISVPFKKINSLLTTIRNASFLGIQPFKNIGSISVPQIPLLAQGGILKKGQIGLLEGSGAEAVVPLEKNTKWISKVADELKGAKSDRFTVREDRNMVDAFKTALSQMKIELDDEVAGKFVERTVARAVYS